MPARDPFRDALIASGILEPTKNDDPAHFVGDTVVPVGSLNFEGRQDVFPTKPKESSGIKSGIVNYNMSTSLPSFNEPFKSAFMAAANDINQQTSAPAPTQLPTITIINSPTQSPVTTSAVKPDSIPKQIGNFASSGVKRFADAMIDRGTTYVGNKAFSKAEAKTAGKFRKRFHDFAHPGTTNVERLGNSGSSADSARITSAPLHSAQALESRKHDAKVNLLRAQSNQADSIAAKTRKENDWIDTLNNVKIDLQSSQAEHNLESIKLIAKQAITEGNRSELVKNNAEIQGAMAKVAHALAIGKGVSSILTPLSILLGLLVPSLIPSVANKLLPPKLLPRKNPFKKKR